MTRESFFHTVGFSIVAAAYLASAYFVLRPKLAEKKSDQITIRIAHWQLETGLQQAFEEVSKAFTREHPNIRVEQLVVPERIFPNWLVTQLIGGTAPDLIEMGMGADDERTARFFLPLTTWVEQPNPFNAGTALANVPWRDTFLDGMNNGFNAALQDYYSVGTTLHNVRLYYNRQLFEEIMGPGVAAPTHFEELQQVFARVEQYNRTHQRKITTIAGSNYNGPIVLDDYLSNQTQKLLLRLDPLQTLLPGKIETQIAYYRGKWSFDSPELQSGLALQHEVGRNLTKGFQSLRREDATFYFLQRRALMIASGTWDVRTLKAQAPFPIGIAPIALPTPSNPLYGRNVLGPFAEASNSSSGFGITRQSKHPQAALAFLQFLTSQRGNQLFADTSYWLPTVIGVKIPAPIQAFAPITEGYTPGLAFNIFGSDARLVITQNLYHLYGDIDPVATFVDSIENKLKPAIRRDIQQEIKTREHHISHDDTTLGALLWKRHLEHASDDSKRKISAIMLNQNDMEAMMYFLQNEIDTTPPMNLHRQ